MYHDDYIVDSQRIQKLLNDLKAKNPPLPQAPVEPKRPPRTMQQSIDQLYYSRFPHENAYFNQRMHPNLRNIPEMQPDIYSAPVPENIPEPSTTKDLEKGKGYFDFLIEVEEVAKKPLKDIRTIDWLDKNKPKWTEKLVDSIIYESAWSISKMFKDYIAPSILDTKSMEPALLGGDIVVLKYSDGKDLDVGDVITFWHTSDDRYGGSVIHRIVEVTPEGYVTQGDNVKDVDPGLRTPDDVEAKKVFRIPLGEIPYFKNLMNLKTQRYYKDSLLKGHEDLGSRY